jgi:Cu/Ag efflux protein CusF
MKTLKPTTWLAVGVSVLTVSAAWRAPADESPTAAQNDRAMAAAGNDKSYTGMIVSIDPNDHVMRVKNWAMFTRKFNLGANCFYAQVDNNNAPATDLRPGEKVTVRYQSMHGVLIADRVQQEPMRFAGTIIAMDNDKHTLTLHRPGLDKVLYFPNEYKIVLRDGKAGSLADVKIGNYVTATYEMPDNDPTIRQIAQTAIAFTGTLTAVNLNDKTVQAKAAFASKKFELADNCAIMINGKPDGHLSDLKLNDKLLFNYDEINGVNVVTRIGAADAPANNVAVSPPPVTGYGYGNGGF